MEWVTSTLPTTSKHGVNQSSVTTVDVHTSSASSWTDAPADLNGLVRLPKDEICFLRVSHHISNAVYKLTFAQLVNKFLVFLGIQRLKTAFETARHNMVY